MRRPLISFTIVLAVVLSAAVCLVRRTVSAQSKTDTSNALAAKLRAQRTSATDLEVGGELAGLPAGVTRYVARKDLLALPQATFTVTDDPNFNGPTQVAGVPLEALARDLGAAPTADLVVAICDDKYRANYPRAYLAEHHPVLVLKIDGKPPARWPKDPDGHGDDMGPYMISQAEFRPSFKILSDSDEAQIPWGVVRLEFREEKTVFGAIAPRGAHASDPGVRAGYEIAEQNCFRCHNMGKEGGQKSGASWSVLSALATESPAYFTRYVRNPAGSNPQTQMQANPKYDDTTMRALIAYFQTFSQREKP
jgi:cytochrome c2